MATSQLLVRALCLAFPASLAVAQSPAPATAAPAGAALTSGIVAGWMDPSVRPQDDLFGYANGTWLKTVPIPADHSWNGEMADMREDSLTQQHAILEAAKTSSNPEERKAGDLYASFMDTAAVEDRGMTPLQPMLDSVKALSSSAQMSALMGDFYRIGVATPVAAEIDPDHKDSAHYAFYISQGGLGMPDRDYFLSKDKKLAEFKAAYRKHIEATLKLSGDANAAEEADHILALETAIAKIEWTNVQNRDPIKTYNAMTVGQLATLAPAIDWKAFFAHANIAGSPTLVVAQPSYLKSLSVLIGSTSIDTWKQYFRFRVFAARSRYLSQAFADEDFNFRGHVLNGTPEEEVRWKRGCELADEMIGEETGKLYVAKYFPAETKARVDQMVDNLVATYRTSIDTLTWMSPPAKIEAKAKLASLNRKIGYPDQWRNYSALSISADDLMGNVTNAIRFEQDRKAAQLPGPVDRSEWDMTVTTVNDYYSQELNEVVFPAASLQPPAFDAKADDAYNYGSTGATIGHEMSHGFDDEGSQYDAKGNLRDWMSKADHAKFKAMTARIVKEFNGFTPLPGFHINGELTLGENIADIAGLEIAYKAYIASLNGQPAPVIDGMTGDQRFYLGFAQSWLGKEREAALIAQLKSDPHSPEKYRVDGVVIHMPSFYSAFSVGPKDKMYLAPADRVTLW